MSKAWFYTKNGQPQDAVTEEQLKTLVGSGDVRGEDLVWCEGMSEWQTAAEIFALVPANASPPAGLFCSNCGSPNEPQARFCEKCGFSFSPPVMPQAYVPAEPQTTSHSSSGLRYGLIVGVVLVAAVAGAWTFLHGKSVADGYYAKVSSQVGAAFLSNADREQAFQSFTRALERMEALESGSGDKKTLLEALKYAEKATLIDPSPAPYWHLLGYVYAQFKGDALSSVMAEDALERALAINPDNISSHLLLARLLMERASYAKALDHLESVGRKNPQVLGAALTSDMCRAYLVDSQLKRGEAFFRGILSQRPASSSIRLGLSILLHEQANTEDALKNLSTLLNDGQTTVEDAAYARVLDKAWRENKS